MSRAATQGLVHFALFQLGWFACVLAAARDIAWAGTAIACAIVAWHIARASRPRAALSLVLAAAAIGAVWESVLVAIGWIRYPSGVLVAGTAPHWIVALWMLFATTLEASLASLARDLRLAAALGAVGGPLAYLAGEKLGALRLVEPGAALAALALGWALFAPLLVAIARRSGGAARGGGGSLRAEPTRA